MNGRDDGGAGASLVTWVALVLAIVALILGWIAYNRTGEDLEERIQEGVRNAAEETQNTVEEGVQELDAGPDSVDEDDTDVPQQNQGTP